MPAASAWWAIAGAAPSRMSPPASCRLRAPWPTTAAASPIIWTRSRRCPVMYHFGERDKHITAERHREDQGGASGGHLPSIPGGPRLQLRPARQLRSRERRAGARSARSNSLPIRRRREPEAGLNLQWNLAERLQRCCARKALIDGKWVDADAGATHRRDQSRDRREARHRAEHGRRRNAPRHRAPRTRRCRRGRRRPPRSAPASCAAGST